MPGFLARLRGRAPSAELVRAVGERYRHIGGATPALGLAKSVATKLEHACGLPVYVGMLTWHPLIEDVVERMAADGVRRALAVCLVPHYSHAGVGAYFRALIPAAQAAGISVDTVQDWHLAPAYLDALAEGVAAALAPAGSASPGSRPEGATRAAHVVFTSHSLPKDQVAPDDPYTSQLRQTGEQVAQRLGLSDDQWTIAYQGVSGRPEDWLGPTVEEVLARLAARGRLLARQAARGRLLARQAVHGLSHVVVCPFGFVLDQVEILYDLDRELRDHAAGLGVELTRTPLLNDSPPLIAILRDLTDLWNESPRTCEVRA